VDACGRNESPPTCPRPPTPGPTAGPQLAHSWIDKSPTARPHGYPQVVHTRVDPEARRVIFNRLFYERKNAPRISSLCDALAVSRGCNRHADACDRRRAGVSSEHLRGAMHVPAARARSVGFRELVGRNRILPEGPIHAEGRSKVVTK
jgi:hypothetical protein